LAEWFKALVLKTSDGKLSVSSNLTASAKSWKIMMTTYNAEAIGVLAGFKDHLQLTSRVDLQVGDTLLFRDGEALVYSKEEHMIRIAGKKCNVEAFVLEKAPNKYVALARTTHNGKIKIVKA
jgi:hypothetical protein